MSGEITQLLHAAARGDERAGARLYERAYEELRRLARAQLRRPGPRSMQTTELVNEAYLKLCDPQKLEVGDRDHFYSLAARVMRQVVVDHFRARSAAKRGAAIEPLELRESDVPVEQRGAVLLALDEALERLKTIDERMARAVELFFFGGMPHEQIGRILGVTDRTVRRDLQRARAFLARELAD